ncbi:hypothetical protein RvY_02229 [Ramazzottius varieornatus]|uniref:Uncharacterized protein n=1 Tax=Ramazzottius varieornatus TaxID=947166 RepID=A0A1D1UJ04_RAMVA|nr:hypothetical protein RvY_02229 [Ramazzottius varieornatus]
MTLHLINFLDMLASLNDQNLLDTLKLLVNSLNIPSVSGAAEVYHDGGLTPKLMRLLSRHDNTAISTHALQILVSITKVGQEAAQTL